LPVGHDPQKPHTRDEIYFVTRGKASFSDRERRYPVEDGSFIFVPAGEVHRFEGFSADFVVWVAFYGPEGGEKDA
jgi:mannose-6-phosphate isomerase-like protein (cupin superfamily)